MARPSTPSAAAPRCARLFVALFLATLVVCPLAAVNLWPFTNWELFSRLRTDQQIGWRALAVDSAGREHGYPIALLPHGYRPSGSIVADFSGRSAAERDAICSAWLRDASHRFGSGTRLVRIYRLEWLLSDRQGRRAAAPHPTLAWICSTKGAREVG
jgi:hypothetical protein